MAHMPKPCNHKQPLETEPTTKGTHLISCGLFALFAFPLLNFYKESSWFLKLLFFNLQMCVHTLHHHVPLWDWLAICFVSLSISCLNDICDHNQQKSRSNIEQHWEIFAVSSLFPWLAVCCYFTGHKQGKHQDFQQPGSRWIHAECRI